MALSGTLKDFGIADIFQLIGQQQKTGVLHLSEREEEVHVAFKDGNIVRAECATRKKKELLGDMLVRAGLITERQLTDALEEQKRTLKRLGDILVTRRSVDHSALRQMAQLQTCETIYRLFAWKSGTYAFETADVEFDPGTVSPIRSESVLMEGFRRVDEWPVIRKRITSHAMTFEKAKDLPELPSAGSDEVDKAFDAFEGGEGGEVESAKGEFENLGPNERRVFKLAETGNDVAWIIDRSRLGEFEACKSLLNLLNGGFLRPLATRGAKKDDPAASRRRRVAEVLVGGVGKLAAAVALLAALAVVAIAAPASPLAPKPAEDRDLPVVDPALQRVAARAQLARLRVALTAHVAERGKSPASLAELVAAGSLSEQEVRYPFAEPYYYRKTGEATWVLLPPVN
jgi:hypothetical protein